MFELYDSLSRAKKQVAPPAERKKIRLFVCGPTVYDNSHIGHASAFIFFDFLAKLLRSRGYEVKFVANITDVDDKIIRRAQEENVKPEDLAKKFSDIFLRDMKAIGVDAVDVYAPATKFISQIVAQVERLIDKGYAYKIDGDGWYFDISKDPDYGKLSGRTALEAEDSVSRVDDSVGKRNKGDFCLWKFSKPGEPVWTASIGNGRPGWHIEDTAISEFYFGPQYEIHGGGIDLKFPHHEAEIAQQESASGLKPFVEIWMHPGTLLVEGKKMSKSLHNFITVEEFLSRYSANTLRLIVLSHHYRSPIDYSESVADQAESSLDSINNFLAKLEKIAAGKANIKSDGKKENADNGKENPNGGKEDASQKDIMDKTEKAIAAALDDDVNTAGAIAKIFEMITELQPKIWTLDKDTAKNVGEYIKNKLKILGIFLKTPEIPENAYKLAADREQFRANQQFNKSDELRREINSLGFDIEDTPEGPFIWPQRKNHN